MPPQRERKTPPVEDVNLPEWPFRNADHEAEHERLKALFSTVSAIRQPTTTSNTRVPPIGRYQVPISRLREALQIFGEQFEPESWGKSLQGHAHVVEFEKIEQAPSAKVQANDPRFHRITIKPCSTALATAVESENSCRAFLGNFSLEGAIDVAQTDGRTVREDYLVKIMLRAGTPTATAIVEVIRLEVERVSLSDISDKLNATKGGRWVSDQADKPGNRKGSPFEPIFYGNGKSTSKDPMARPFRMEVKSGATAQAVEHAKETGAVVYDRTYRCPGGFPSCPQVLPEPISPSSRGDCCMLMRVQVFANDLDRAKVTVIRAHGHSDGQAKSGRPDKREKAHLYSEAQKPGFKPRFYALGNPDSKLSKDFRGTVKSVAATARKDKFGRNTVDTLVQLADENPGEIEFFNFENGIADEDFCAVLVRFQGLYDLIVHGGRVCGADSSAHNKPCTVAQFGLDDSFGLTGLLVSAAFGKSESKLLYKRLFKVTVDKLGKLSGQLLAQDLPERDRSEWPKRLRDSHLTPEMLRKRLEQFSVGFKPVALTLDKSTALKQASDEVFGCLTFVCEFHAKQAVSRWIGEFVKLNTLGIRNIRAKSGRIIAWFTLCCRATTEATYLARRALLDDRMDKMATKPAMRALIDATKAYFGKEWFDNELWRSSCVDYAAPDMLLRSEVNTNNYREAFFRSSDDLFTSAHGVITAIVVFFDKAWQLSDYKEKGRMNPKALKALHEGADKWQAGLVAWDDQGKRFVVMETGGRFAFVDLAARKACNFGPCQHFTYACEHENAAQMHQIHGPYDKFFLIKVPNLPKSRIARLEEARSQIADERTAEVGKMIRRVLAEELAVRRVYQKQQRGERVEVADEDEDQEALTQAEIEEREEEELLCDGNDESGGGEEEEIERGVEEENGAEEADEELGGGDENENGSERGHDSAGSTGSGDHRREVGDGDLNGNLCANKVLLPVAKSPFPDRLQLVAKRGRPKRYRPLQPWRGGNGSKHRATATKVQGVQVAPDEDPTLDEPGPLRKRPRLDM